MKKVLKTAAVLLATALLAVAGLQLNAQTNRAIMTSVGEQGVIASADTKGAFLFVSPDKDMVAKEGAAGDSWYVISHLTSGNRKFDVLIHYIGLKEMDGVPSYEATVTVFDPVTKKYVVEDKTYTQSEGSLSKTDLNVQLPMGFIKGNINAMQVTGNTAHVKADLILSNKGKVLANMGNGIIPFYGEFQYEFALPNMATSGTLTLNGEKFTVSGTSWLDRQWGNAGPTMAQKKWTWIGISLDNGDYISLWDMFEPNIEHAYATVLHPDGRQEIVDVEPVANGASDFWKSPLSNQTYPTHLAVSIPQLKAHFTVAAFIKEQEIITTGLGGTKYEGASNITGTMAGKPITGHAVLEMVGNWK